MRLPRAFLGVCLIVCVGGEASSGSPIQKVLGLLGSLQQKIIRDGENQQTEYEAVARQCRENSMNRIRDIKSAAEKIIRLESMSQKAVSDIAEHEAVIAEVTGKVANCDESLAKATKIREADRKNFREHDASLSRTIEKCEGVLKQIKKNARLGGRSFLQVTDAHVGAIVNSLRSMVDAAVFASHDNRRLAVLLQDETEDSTNQSLLDVVTDIKNKAVREQEALRRNEMQNKHNFEMLSKSITNEKQTQSEKLERKKKLKAGAEESKAQAQGDLEVVRKEKAEDEKYLRDLKQNCMLQASEFESEQRERTAELSALKKAREVLMQSTKAAGGREYSFVQVAMATHLSASIKASQAAADAIEDFGNMKNDEMFTQLAYRMRTAISAGEDPFAKIKEMLHSMIRKMEGDLRKDSDQRAFCDKEMGKSKKRLNSKASTHETLTIRTEKAKADITKIGEEIGELQRQLSELIKTQASEDSARQAAHKMNLEALEDYKQGLAGVRTATKVIRDYYASSESESLMQTDSKPSGIIGFLEVIESDFQQSLTQIADAEEQQTQSYTKDKEENQVARAVKAEAIKFKEKEKVVLQKNLSESEQDRDDIQDELDAIQAYLVKLKPQCETKAPSFEERKKRREEEIEGLRNALDTLTGEAI